MNQKVIKQPILLTIIAVILVVVVVLIYSYLIVDEWTNTNSTNSAVNKQVESDTWEVYENSRFNFSVEYPASWTLGEPVTNNDGREMHSSGKEIVCRAYGFYNALITEDGDVQTLEEFVDWLLDDKVVVERKDASLAGNPATRVITKIDAKMNESVYALGEEMGYGLYCIFENDEKRESFKDDFDTMVESFKSDRSLDG